MSLRLLAAFALLAPLGAVPARADDAPAAAAPAAAASEPDPTDAWDEQKPPPGAPEDVALWRSGIEVSRAINMERLRANKMQWEHRQRKYDERLAALAKEEGKAEGKRAAALLARYTAAVTHNYVTMTRQWPVDPTRGCRYPAMHFESVLYSPEHKKKATQLLVTREELQDCVDKAKPALKVMADSNKDLAGLFAELETLLPPAPVATPPATGKAPPAPPAAKN